MKEGITQEREESQEAQYGFAQETQLAPTRQSQASLNTQTARQYY